MKRGEKRRVRMRGKHTKYSIPHASMHTTLHIQTHYISSQTHTHKHSIRHTNTPLSLQNKCTHPNISNTSLPMPTHTKCSTYRANTFSAPLSFASKHTEQSTYKHNASFLKHTHTHMLHLLHKCPTILAKQVRTS